jgi:hypothetical protein
MEKELFALYGSLCHFVPLFVPRLPSPLGRRCPKGG